MRGDPPPPTAVSHVRPCDLVLMWHMHQPDFRDCTTGEYRLPWVYLHALKDYSDMAAHLERHPGVRAVVNFVPVLLDQLEDYADQFDTGRVRDPLLAMLCREEFDTLDAAGREFVLDQCFRANHTKMIDPFPAYRRLLELFQFAEARGPGTPDYLSGQYFADLVTWYHLAWTGETVRRSHALIVELISKGHGFTLMDRRKLFEVIGEVIRGVVPRWQRLAASGQVEISTTPHYHPIGPLMLEFAAARESQPALPLPHAEQYPGGRQRLSLHLELALESHARRFGARPAGLWPAEGAVSDAFLALLSTAGVRWTASGQSVLAATLARAAGTVPDPDYPYRGYRFGEHGPACFFRDDRLSDLIGFEYARWHGRDAAAHFIAELERIGGRAPAGDHTLVSVILDGENAWEYYPYNGFYFLDDLYTALETHPALRTTTYRDYLERIAPDALAPLPPLVAGSWVFGNLSTWIGAPEKNRAWDLLCEAKRNFDLVMASGRLSAAARDLASRQLAICEGSDWFWWFGDYNPQAAVESMDRVFRANLSRLYQLLALPVPAGLAVPISHGGGEAELGGAMRRAS